MYTIYHNPRCRKSREALDFLKKENIQHEVILYLETTLSEEKIKNILVQLQIHPEKLIRTQESIWKELFKNKELDRNQYITILSKYPKLIERPIITKNQKGIIAKPIKNLIKFIDRI
ncbi:MAG: ArsC/Spx/MgsR family protein [Flavobacteriaceae bacterium]|nr:ArsC/Spx/MgsR family protein [Flavobacteriaceae bacterium]